MIYLLVNPTEIVVGKNKIFIFYEYFVNNDMSVAIAHSLMKLSTCIHEIQMEGSVSQNFDIGPSLNFIKSRN